MASLLFILGSDVMNELVFSGTNYVFSRFTDNGEQERKRHDLVLENLQRARDECNKDRMKRFDFINKRLREKKMKQEHTSKMLMKQCLNTKEYLQNKSSLCHPSPNYEVFIIHQRPKKVVNYFLLQWVRAWQHMLFISTLNKWQTKN